MEDFKDLQQKINQRYSEESKQSCNLSCGTNLDFIEIAEGDSILDLGCGKGNETIQSAIMSGKSGFATGLDITPEMIYLAKENAVVQNIKNVDFVQGSIENLPFEDHKFDAVISNCVINHAKDKKRVYMEIFRVLKQGGRFVVSDAVTKYPLPSEVKDTPEAWAQCFGGAVTEEEYIESIKSAGFDSINILKKREYIKNGYDFRSLTIKAYKK
jgi:ubiquinone/menaquinone biosynthesis C-methylase UbiE